MEVTTQVHKTTIMVLHYAGNTRDMGGTVTKIGGNLTAEYAEGR